MSEAHLYCLYLSFYCLFFVDFVVFCTWDRRWRGLGNCGSRCVVVVGLTERVRASIVNAVFQLQVATDKSIGPPRRPLPCHVA